jgi:hypothetical protein
MRIKQLAFITVLLLVGCQNYPDATDVAGWKTWADDNCTGQLYRVPETGHKPYELSFLNPTELRAQCGRLNYGRIQRNHMIRSENGKRPWAGACYQGGTIYLPDDGGAFMSMCHELAHADDTYSH